MNDDANHRRPAAPAPHPSADGWVASSATWAQVDRCLALAVSAGPRAALRALLDQLRTAAPPILLDCARILLERDQPLLAAALLDSALTQYPVFPRLRYWFARAWWQAGDVVRAESELRRILTSEADADAAMLLAQVLRSQGRFNAAAAAVVERAEVAIDDAAVVLDCAQFVRECQRQDLAADLCERALAGGNADPRLHALAGNIAQELGRFDQARGHYLRAIERGIDLNVWFVLSGLASIQRYRDRQHPDFSLFERRVRDPMLSPRARAAILFALGKACDDVGDFAAAARAWREANGLMHPLTRWSRAQWRDFVAGRMAAAPTLASHVGDQGCVPIFVVGLPRTGTTLVAELLGRHPDVRNRGELPTLGYLAERLIALSGAQRSAGLAEAATIYLAHLRRDDTPSRCYIDKNPLNFRYLDVVAALFPNARVIHCRRHARDTALSIWGQSFASDEYGFASDFGDIAALAEGCDELMAHWRRTLPIPILTVDYEQVAADPAATIGSLFPLLGLAPFDLLGGDVADRSAITSASLWQARQPVHRRSVARWRNYAEYLPELLQLFRD